MTRPRLSLRREVAILLPASLVLLAVLSTATLFAFRSGLELLVEERREEAARAARTAAQLPAAGAGDAVALRQLARGALGAAVVGADGVPVVTVGDLPPGDLLAPLAGRSAGRGVGAGPGPELPARVVGFAALGESGRTLRLDFPAATLAAQRRSARVLTVVVLGVNGAVLVLVLLFLRHLLSPFEALLLRAREVGGGGGDDDEIAFLLATFERAVEALGRQQAAGDDELRTLERTLAASLESGLLLLDREGGTLALNAVGAELLGVEQPAEGTPVAAALAPHPSLARLLAEAVAAQREVRRQEVAVGGRTLGLTVHPLRRDDGGVRGYLVLFADLTEARRQDSENRLAEGLERLGEMAAGVAHELRNSLATLRGYLALIERHPEEESVTDYLGELRRETDTLGRVVEDFLTFARPGTARLQTVDLEALVRRATADPALASAQVEVAAATGPLLLRGDPQLLERALANLLRNAVEAEGRAGRRRPRPRVSLRPTAEGVEVEVADRGDGVPSEVRRRLFLPFVTGRADGVGLGLAVSHRIATLHGGRLRVEDRPGGGTVAVLSLPRDIMVTKGNDRE